MLNNNVKIISGGQSGVDRAALDAAILYKFSHGGWCPKDRWAEDGTIDRKYLLKETPSNDVNQRTKWNIRDSDATLVFVEKIPSKANDGTILTINTIKSSKKPFLIIDLSLPYDENSKIINQWLIHHNIRILNIAGPRESQAPGIYKKTFELINHLIEDKFPYIKNKKIFSKF